MKNIFKEAREKAGLKQTVVACELNIGQSTISMWETGESYPRTEMLLKIAKLYNCTVDYLLKGDATQEDTA